MACPKCVPPGERILIALGRLQGAAAGTPFESLVDDLVEAMAADTTVADLRQEIEFVKAENATEIPWPYRGVDSTA